jgi:phosphoribosylamine--glycine ligase
VLYWCDGEHFAALPTAQDFKRVAENDRGPNTGGMGSFCPAQHFTAEMDVQVANNIVKPTITALAGLGSPFKGILYAGLMITQSGPQVIEFNCRFGDPETQVILPCWEGDFVETLLACVHGELQKMVPPKEAIRHAVCVVLAARGYPGSYNRSIPLKTVADSEQAVTFHAGTARVDGRLESAGGRVLNAVGLGETRTAARENAYQLAQHLLVPGLFCRSDIASN